MPSGLLFTTCHPCRWLLEKSFKLLLRICRRFLVDALVSLESERVKIVPHAISSRPITLALHPVSPASDLSSSSPDVFPCPPHSTCPNPSAYEYTYPYSHHTTPRSLHLLTHIQICQQHSLQPTEDRLCTRTEDGVLPAVYTRLET